MTTKFTSVTQLQRNTKHVLSSDDPFQVLLSNNEMVGMLLSKKFASYMIDSGLLEQMREELWELNDKETTELILKHRSGKTKPVSFDNFSKKYENI